MKAPLDQIAAVVLAGGLGTRVRHLLPDVPKPMAPVRGRPFLEWVVRYLANEGIRRVTISAGYLGPVIEQHFQSVSIPAVTVGCVTETVPLGTAGGFLHAASTVRDRPETWLVANGDTLVLPVLAEVACRFAEDAVAGIIVAVNRPDASRYGTLHVSPAGDLLGFNEKKTGRGVINAGMYLFSERHVRQFPNHRPLSLEAEVIPQLVAQGARLKACITDAPFLDIGTPSSLRQADAFVKQHLGRFSLS